MNDKYFLNFTPDEPSLIDETAEGLNNRLFSLIRSGNIEELNDFTAVNGGDCLAWKKLSNEMLPVFYAASIGAVSVMDWLCKSRGDLVNSTYRGMTLWEVSFHAKMAESHRSHILALAAYYENEDAIEEIYASYRGDNAEVIPFPGNLV